MKTLNARIAFFVMWFIGMPCQMFSTEYTPNENEFFSGGLLYAIIDNNSVAVMGRGGLLDYSGDIVVPATVENNGAVYNVTTLANDAFSSYPNIKSVYIGKNVNSIDNNWFSFAGSVNLESVQVDPENAKYDSREDCNAIIETATNELIAACYKSKLVSSIKTLSQNSFSGIANLKTIDVCEGIETISFSAIGACKDLETIRISKTVSSIGNYQLVGCDNLANIEIDNDNQYYDSRDNCNAIIEKSSKTLIAGCYKSVIPTDVTSIGYYAFQDCARLSQIYITDGVTSIGMQAFYNCSNLENITIGSSLKTIEQSAFGMCNNIKGIVVSDGNPYYDSRDNCNALIETESNTLVMGCSSTIIPNDILKIGINAFANCEGLTEVKIPNSVQTIGAGVFYQCPKLVNVEIGTGITSIRELAFSECPSLKKICINAETPPNTYYEGTSGYYNTFSQTDISKVTLYVPSSTIDTYKNSVPWDGFMNILSIEDYISSITPLTDVDKKSSFYSVGGVRSSMPLKGLNIIKMSNGNTKKTIIK